MRRIAIVGERRADERPTSDRRPGDSGFVVQLDGFDTQADYTALDYAAVLAQPPVTEAPVLPRLGTIDGTGRSVVDLTTLTSSQGFIVQGDSFGDRAGSSVSSAGDVNGDGIGDFIVGATFGNRYGGLTGEAYVIFGSRNVAGVATGGRQVVDLTTLDGSQGFVVRGDAENDLAGDRVSGAGDVNGDGIDDLIVGAPAGDDGGSNAGEAYVIFGSRIGFGSFSAGRQIIELRFLSHANGFVIQGDTAGDRAGMSVAGAGDINGDGIDDVIVGAGGGDDGGTDAGEAYVIFGSRAGFGPAGGARQVLDLTNLSATQGFIIQGGIYDYTGSAVSSAGDVNGDGIDDVFITATEDGEGGRVAGAAFVVFGSRAGFGTAIGGRQVIDLANLPGSLGFKILGDMAYDRLGAAVALAGDVNGDGIDDIIVGSAGNNGGGNLAGSAYVVFGSRTGFGVTYSNGRQVLDTSTLTASQGFIIQGDAAFDNAGRSVASAGDINNDGLDDLLVGAPEGGDGGTEAGEAYVVFGTRAGFGSAVGGRQVVDLTTLSATQGFIVQGDTGRDGAGGSVSAAGDVDGDGIDDLIIGAPTGSDGGGYAGEAYVIFGEAAAAATPFPSVIDLDPANFPSSLGFKIQGDVTRDYAGGSVSSAGDVNGDGFADFIVGTRISSGGSGAGAAYVIFGKASGFSSLIDLTGLAPTDGFKIQGEVAYDGPGVVSSAGDVNGDGFADILVGATGNNSMGRYDAGAAYVIFGRASGFGNLVNLDGMAASTGFKIQGVAGDAAGGSVSSAGDINSDGFADLIIGASRTNSGGGYSGAAYVIFGKASGFDGVINLATLSADTGFIIRGETDNGYAGYSVSSAGDVNGDGFADVIVGARADRGGGVRAGAAYVIFGKASGFGNLIDLAGLSASSGIKIQGDAGDYAGCSVSSAGDVNGDGFADLIVGARSNISGGLRAGAAFVVFGKANGFGNLIDLTRLSPTDGFKIQGDVAYDSAGRSVSSAGDVNGDGFADIIVGATANSSGNERAGAAYVIFGRASGFGGLIDLTGLLLTDGFKIRGDVGEDAVGFSVSSAGDINGDGFADMIVGAPGNDSGGPSAGAAYVIFGHATPPIVVNAAPTGTDRALTIDEDTPRRFSAADFGYSDNDGNLFLAVRITSLPSSGTLRLNGNAVTAGDTIAVANLANLVFTPQPNANGIGYSIMTFQVQDDGGTALGGTDIDPSANYFLFNVNAVDDTPVAVADARTVTEGVTAAFSVIDNDTDIDGGPIVITAIQGRSAAVGVAIRLTSGASVMLNTDGTISYDQNDRFTYLISPTTAAAVGALNGRQIDRFEYVINGNSRTEVTVTINGVDGATPQLQGDSGHNRLTGTSGNELFNLSQGGGDVVFGGGGNDGFYFGREFNTDFVDGGAGTLDQIGLQGDYSLGVTIDNHVVGVEQIVLMSGNDTRFAPFNENFSYRIIVSDVGITPGQTLTFQANVLRAGERFTLDASAELDGSVFTYGGLGYENLKGSQNVDAFFFGTGRFNAGDIVDGQGGFDQLGLQGTYSGVNAVTFGAGQLLNLEMIVCLSNNDSRFGGAGSGTPYSYALTMNNGNVAAGATLIIQANALVSDEVLTFNGAAELDGHYTIYSGDGADSIIGGALSDTISGRGGADNLTGGGGGNSFLYTNLTDSIAAAQDHILDFTSGDVIDLSRLDAVAGEEANDAFAFIGAGAFSNTAGQLRAVNTSGNDWLVEADVNGDGVADLSILVTVADAHVLSAGDFTL